MKAQIPIEFIISALIFLTFFFFAWQSFTSAHPKLSSTIKEKVLWSKAYRISELLLNDEGFPKDWESKEEIKRVGFASGLNNLSLAKLQKFNELFDCSLEEDYAKVKELLGVNFDFGFLVLNLSDNSVILKCYPSKIRFRGFNISVERIASLLNHFAKLRVEVW